MFQTAPHASVIINGIYWAVGAPRLITIPDAKNLLRPQQTPWIPRSEGCPHLPHRLLAICDISADPGGSIEFMQECTTINHPFQLYDAEQHIDYERYVHSFDVCQCYLDKLEWKNLKQFVEGKRVTRPHLFEHLLIYLCR